MNVATLAAWWSTYDTAVMVSAGLVGLALVLVAIRRILRSPQRDRWISGLAAVIVLAWTSEGLWEVAVGPLGLPWQFAVMTFVVFEAMMLSTAMRAEQHRRRHGTPGQAGVFVWVLAAASGTVAALAADSAAEVVLRLLLPLLAAAMWWIGITAERDSDTDQVRARRAEAARKRAATWAVTPRTVLIGLGLMRPADPDFDMTAAERERRIRRMVVAAVRLRTSGPRSPEYRRAVTQLRKLARLACDEEVAEVRQRVARAEGIVALMSAPEATPEQGGTSAPEQGPEHASSSARNWTRNKVMSSARNSSAPARLRKRSTGREGGNKAERIRTLLAQNPNLTRAELARRAEVSDRYVRAVLSTTAEPATSSAPAPQRMNGSAPEL